MNTTYSPSEDQIFDGQLSFLQALRTDFDKCFAIIQEHGFQTGWKKITAKPQHGNHNPNWKDCLDFLRKVIVNYKYRGNVCPDLPICNNLPVCREDYTEEDFWFHMLELALLHEEILKENTSGKRDGTIKAAYTERFV